MLWTYLLSSTLVLAMSLSLTSPGLLFCFRLLWAISLFYQGSLYHWVICHFCFFSQSWPQLSAFIFYPALNLPIFPAVATVLMKSAFFQDVTSRSNKLINFNISLKEQSHPAWVLNWSEVLHQNGTKRERLISYAFALNLSGINFQC